MTNTKINEYLAEHMFGLVEKRKGSNCYYDIKSDEPRQIGCPSYIKDYQPVLEKLLSDKNIYISFGQQLMGTMWFCHIIRSNDRHCLNGELGYTIGEAICRCAVEYLKAKGDK